MTSTVDSPFLSQLGLTNESFRATGGQAAASMLVTSLTYITNPTVSLELRADIARKIRIWQEKATVANKQAGFQQGYSKFIETLQELLQHPDGHQSALHLAQALAKECATSPILSYGKSALTQFMGMFQAACGDSSRLIEGTVLVEIIKLLVECLPNTADEVGSIATLLFQLFFSLSAAPSLKGCIARKLYCILHTEQATPASPPKPFTLLETHLDSVLQAIRQGHTEFASLVLANKRICSVTSTTIEKNLPALIDSIGYAALEDIVLRLAEVEPAKVVPSVSTLVLELGKPQGLVGQKVSILGVLLTVVSAQGAVPLVPLLDEIGRSCSEIPDLYIPLFKVLTSLCVVSTEEVTLKSLVLVSTIAKNAYYKVPSIQAAILDCVNILKDQCKYSNLFQSETLKVFEAFSVHNLPVYKNIILWNSGKSAKKGNNADFLLNAGAVTSAEAPASGLRSWFGSPKKVKSSNSGSACNSNANTPTHAGYGNYSTELRGPENVHFSPAHYSTHNSMSSLPAQPVQYTPQSPYHTPNKGNTVAPSPHSQSLALMQQQLYAQQQQLQHQMLLVQQMQIQEQLAQFQPVGSVGHADGSNSSGANSYGGNGALYTGNTIGASNQPLLQSPGFLPPNIHIPNYTAATPVNNNQPSPYVYNPPSNPYVLGVQSVLQPASGVPLNMSPPPPQYSVNAQQAYTTDSYIPVNNVYNKNYTAPKQK